MFERRPLSGPVDAIREEYASSALVFDCERDFETLPPAQAEELGLVVDSLSPASYPADWLPADAPTLVSRYASETFTIGLPGDGSVVWTRQTDPPVVLVKPRVEGSPESFVDFLLAEAFCELSHDLPEQCLGFFGESYSSFDEAVPLGPVDTYQLAAALFDAWTGLHTREEFATWHERHPAVAASWKDAGDRLEGRVDGLPGAVARGETAIGDAAELACNAIKHAIELPAPFAALDTTAYRDHGAPYAVRWAEKTFDALEE